MKIRILFFRENGNIEYKNVKISNNQFLIEKKIYLVDNPHYVYSVKKIFFFKYLVRTLVFKENFKTNIDLSQNLTIENQLKNSIMDNLFMSKAIADAFSPVNEINYFIFMIFVIVAFVVGFIGGKF